LIAKAFDLIDFSYVFFKLVGKIFILYSRVVIFALPTL